MGIFNEFNKKEKPVFTGSRFGFGSGAAAVTTSIPTEITTRGIIFDFDPGDVTGLSDGAVSTNADLVSGINQDNTAGTNTAIAISGGTLTYRTAAGGHFDSTSNGGRIIISGTSVISALNACTSMTITCWFQSTGSGRHVLVSRYGTGYPNQFNHIVDPTGDFHYNCDGVIPGSSGNLDTNAWSNDTWHLSHWTYDVSDGIAHWFVDGSEVTTVNLGTDSGNGLTVSDSDGFALMSRADRHEDLVGRMGPVRIHNVALTAQECADDFTVERARFGV